MGKWVGGKVGRWAGGRFAILPMVDDQGLHRPFIAIFVVNILLWVDFNITAVRRRKQREPPTSRLRCVRKR